MDVDAFKHCISCTNVPSALLVSTEAKQHFSQFGKLVRLHLKPKSGTCRIQYANEESVDRAVKHAGLYKGQPFSVVKMEKSKPKLKKKAPDPTWLPDPEVKAELDAMEGTGKYYFRNEAVVGEGKPEKKRVWPAVPKKVKKPQEQVFSVPPEQRELINLLKQPALSVEEQYRALDARDKLIRLRTHRQADLQTQVTVGTCPDMCPEKERLMRETQHQVALYEQEPSSKTMNPHIAVKQYSRSSADQEAPLPHELRPVPVLQMTMGYLMHNIIDLCDNQDVNLGEWYHFLWDRTRGIRKDITQQALCCQGSVELVEQCARFHIHCSARLVAEDPSVFDHKINTENLTKCLQTLKYMYHDLRCKNESCPNEAEFRAYIILLNLNDGNFMWELQQLRPEIQKSREVAFSLDVYSALDKNNYVKFFKLVRETTYLNACILLRYFIQVRVMAIRTIIKGFSPIAKTTQYPLSELRDILAFEGNASTRDFLEYYGLRVTSTHVVLDRTSFMHPELPYTLDRAINIVESKRHISVGEIISGGALPPKTYQMHIPYTSFDVNGFLNISEFTDVDFKEQSRSNSPFDVVDSKTEDSKSIKEVKSIIEAKSIADARHTLKSEVKSAFGYKTASAFGQKKPEVKNVFGQREHIFDDFDSQDSSKNVNFGQKGERSIFRQKGDHNIFERKGERNFSEQKGERSIFEQKGECSIFEQKGDGSIFEQKGDHSIFERKGERNFSEQKGEGSIFEQKGERSIFEQKGDGSIFEQKGDHSIFERKGERNFSEQKGEGSIFEQKNERNIFGAATRQHPQPDSIFSNRQNPEIFSQNSQESIFAGKLPQNSNVFGHGSTQGNKMSNSGQSSIFQKPAITQNQNIFGQGVPTNKKSTISNTSPYGGFNFELKITEKQRLELERIKQDEEKQRRLEEELQRKKIEDERRKKREIEERNREIEERNREIEERQRLERVLEAQRASEEQQRKMEEARRKKLEEERTQRQLELQKKRLDELRKAQELERQRLEEIRRSEQIKRDVKDIVEDLLTQVEETYKKDRLSTILGNITTRKMRYFVKNWKENMAIRKRKRKAIDDWPIWLNTSTVDEEAKELLQGNQSQVLMDMKRYKSGCYRDLNLSKSTGVTPVNLRDALAKLLTGYLRDNIGDNHVYWKVNVYLPGSFESKNNLRKIEGFVYDLLKWDTIQRIETVKISGKKVTYCLKKHDVFYKDDTTDGYIFLNDAITQKFLENIEKTLKETHNVSFVIILHDLNDVAQLTDLFQATDFKIIHSTFTASSLEFSMKEALEYLAEKSPKPPSLQLDNFKSFLTKYLVNEIWERINTFAKFNRPYAMCLTEPKTVYNLYLDALNRLENLVLDKSRLKTKNFPRDFEKSTAKPDLPCDYKYFPEFWRSESYNRKLRRIFEGLRFENFDISWPPVDERHLEKIVCQISQVFEKRDKVFYTIMGVILRKLEELGDFNDVRYMLWTDVMKIVIAEKLGEFDFELRNPFACDFAELFVVYDEKNLKEFSTEPWFYLSNTSIEEKIDSKEHIVEESDEELVYELDDIDLEKSINEAMSYDDKYDENVAQGKRKIKELQLLMDDLEESMSIQKKISSKFQETMNFVLDNN